MRKRLALLALAAACAFGQATIPFSTALLPRYQANYTASLTSAASKVTVQATAASDPVTFEEADVYCSVACTATVSINGTAATTTSLAISGPLSAESSVTPVAFSASNVGSGTTLKTFNIAAGGTLVLNLGMFYLPPKSGGAQNLTIATSSITGTATIQIQWIGQ